MTFENLRFDTKTFKVGGAAFLVLWHFVKWIFYHEDYLALGLSPY
jgi:hypothetical protein